MTQDSIWEELSIRLKVTPKLQLIAHSLRKDKCLLSDSVSGYTLCKPAASVVKASLELHGHKLEGPGRKAAPPQNRIFSLRLMKQLALQATF